jgi:ribosomal protein L32
MSFFEQQTILQMYLRYSLLLPNPQILLNLKRWASMSFCLEDGKNINRLIRSRKLFMRSKAQAETPTMQRREIQLLECPECGEELEVGFEVCPKCGNKTQEE